MNVNGVGNSMASQLYQVATQTVGGQIVQQQQQVPQQGPPEERSENHAMQGRENRSGGEAQATRLVDTYA